MDEAIKFTLLLRESLVRYMQAVYVDDLAVMREQAVRFGIAFSNSADLPDGLARADLELLSIAMLETVAAAEAIPLEVAELYAVRRNTSAATLHGKEQAGSLTTG